MSMLNWICPECGREVPAADPDCPACTGAIHEQLPLPLVLDPPAADPAGAPVAPAAPQTAEPASNAASEATGPERHSLADLLSEPDHSAPVADAHASAAAPSLVPPRTAASEATGPERHSLAAPLSEPAPSAPGADAHGSAAAPLSPASLEEPRTVSDAQPAEPANHPSLVPIGRTASE